MKTRSSGIMAATQGFILKNMNKYNFLKKLNAYVLVGAFTLLAVFGAFGHGTSYAASRDEVLLIQSTNNQDDSDNMGVVFEDVGVFLDQVRNNEEFRDKVVERVKTDQDFRDAFLVIIDAQEVIGDDFVQQFNDDEQFRDEILAMFQDDEEFRNAVIDVAQDKLEKTRKDYDKENGKPIKT